MLNMISPENVAKAEFLWIFLKAETERTNLTRLLAAACHPHQSGHVAKQARHGFPFISSSSHSKEQHKTHFDRRTHSTALFRSSYLTHTINHLTKTLQAIRLPATAIPLLIVVLSTR